MGRKFIIISCILIFVAAPLLGVVLAGFNRHQTEIANKPQDDATRASKEELLIAAIKYNDLLPEYQKYPGNIDSIINYKLMEKWWYVATVRLTYSVVDGKDKGYVDTTMLFSKFTNQPNSVKVVTGPGESLPYQNISGGRGIPYEVIDELNMSLRTTARGGGNEN